MSLAGLRAFLQAHRRAVRWGVAALTLAVVLGAWLVSVPSFPA
jgi:hypothetical protein